MLRRGCCAIAAAEVDILVAADFVAANILILLMGQKIEMYMMDHSCRYTDNGRRDNEQQRLVLFKMDCGGCDRIGVALRCVVSSLPLSHGSTTVTERRWQSNCQHFRISEEILFSLARKNKCRHSNSTSRLSSEAKRAKLGALRGRRQNCGELYPQLNWGRASSPHH